MTVLKLVGCSRFVNLTLKSTAIVKGEEVTVKDPSAVNKLLALKHKDKANNYFSLFEVVEQKKAPRKTRAVKEVVQEVVQEPEPTTVVAKKPGRKKAVKK